MVWKEYVGSDGRVLNYKIKQDRFGVYISQGSFFVGTKHGNAGTQTFAEMQNLLVQYQIETVAGLFPGTRNEKFISDSLYLSPCNLPGLDCMIYFKFLDQRIKNWDKEGLVSINIRDLEFKGLFMSKEEAISRVHWLVQAVRSFKK